MRTATLLCLSIAFGCAVNAQLTILPQLGFENTRTSVGVKGQSSFSPLGSKFSPQAAIRVDYAFKKSHGPFVGLAASRSLVQYNFLKSETGAAYTASRGDMQLRLEGGYQVRTKPLYFKKAPVVTNSATSRCQKAMAQSGCGKSVARSGCSSKAKTALSKPVDNRTWMRIAPSAGMAYIPGAPQAGIYEKDQEAYQYNAGNWKTALLGGVAFEFGAAAQRKFVVSLNYLKGVSNLGARDITTVVGNKPTATSLKSGASAWNVLLGVPISFGKKQTIAKQPVTEKTYNTQRSSQYKSRCGQYKSSYKGRCTRVI